MVDILIGSECSYISSDYVPVYSRYPYWDYLPVYSRYPYRVARWSYETWSSHFLHGKSSVDLVLHYIVTTSHIGKSQIGHCIVNYHSEMSEMITSK
jgi:hypothetical protein